MQTAIQTVVNGVNLNLSEMQHVMQCIMQGKATDAQIAGLLVALRMKGESVDEITAAASVMRDLASPVHIATDHLVDIVGTGGDDLSTFNISTCCCFVVAAAGASVAKHGNRSVSSRSGSADLLETAGVNLHLSAEQVAECVENIGVGFMFAPLHHKAMKHAVAARKEMAIRTIFNLLGPLTNPAGTRRQLLGVFDKKWLLPLAQVLKNLGSEQVMVVHAKNGMDEISISGETYVAELKQGEITEYTLTPEQFGLQPAEIDTITVTNTQESLAMVEQVFNNQTGTAKDIVLLNAGAAIYVAGCASDLQEGVDMAQRVLANGKAKDKLDSLISVTQKMRSNSTPIT